LFDEYLSSTSSKIRNYPLASMKKAPGLHASLGGAKGMFWLATSYISVDQQQGYS
jgi:hypothetical protein